MAFADYQDEIYLNGLSEAAMPSCRPVPERTAFRDGHLLVQQDQIGAPVLPSPRRTEGIRVVVVQPSPRGCHPSGSPVEPEAQPQQESRRPP